MIITPWPPSSLNRRAYASGGFARVRFSGSAVTRAVSSLSSLMGGRGIPLRTRCRKGAPP